VAILQVPAQSTWLEPLVWVMAAENSICAARRLHYDGADGTVRLGLGRQCRHKILANHNIIEFPR